MSASQAVGTEIGHGTVARNAVYMVLGQVTTTALGIVFSAALARILGAADFGIYFLITSLTVFAYVLVDWGQQVYVIREVAHQPERSSILLGTALAMRVAGAALVAVPSGFAAWAFGYNAITCFYYVVFLAVNLPFFLRKATEWYSGPVIEWASTLGCGSSTRWPCLCLLL